MSFTSDVVAETDELVEPRLAGDAIVWASPAGIHIARRAGSDFVTSKLRTEPSAGVRVAAGPDGRLWAAWDAGGQAMHGMTFHVDGVRLEAGEVGAELRGEKVDDQLWDHCYGQAFDLAVGPDNEPQLAWVVRDRVFHAQRQGGTWTVKKGPLGERDTIAIAVDPEGRPHVVYQRDQILRHAVRDGDKWSETVLGERYETGHVSIATDASGAPHIAFMGRSKSKDQLIYTTRSGGAFVKEIVDKKGNAGFGTRIAIDPGGVPWIGYRVEHSRDGASSRRIAPVEHRVANRRGGNQDKWTVELAATGGAANGFALVGGVPMIAFASANTGGISLATAG